MRKFVWFGWWLSFLVLELWRPGAAVAYPTITPPRTFRDGVLYYPKIAKDKAHVSAIWWGAKAMYVVWEWHVNNVHSGALVLKVPFSRWSSPWYGQEHNYWPHVISESGRELLTFDTTASRSSLAGREIASGMVIRRFQSPPRSANQLLVSTNLRTNTAQVIAVGPSESVVWDFNSGKVIHRFPHTASEKQRAWSGIVSSDGSLFAEYTMSPRKRILVKLWNLETGKLISRRGNYLFEIPEQPNVKIYVVNGAFTTTGKLRLLVWRATGTRDAQNVFQPTASDGQIIEIDLATGQATPVGPSFSSPTLPKSRSWAAFSGDGNRLVTGFIDKAGTQGCAARLVEADGPNAGRETPLIPLSPSHQLDVDISADGTLAITSAAGVNFDTLVWDLPVP